ncbi:ATP synthase subunit I [Clostridium niameyense]|uniref:ATP synthase subunit I n=1 Tax=Clostridium niameyense TaxID=1622073 RepID=A0A6M0RDP9_9CLOT|nr:ATP synthase subunit I [Clostridium niameyense]NEZ47428.1 ATP synthase subunit I [Clostridium niameyense]
MKDFKEMLSKIFILNLFLGVFIFLLIKSIFKVQLGTYFLIGLVVATVNLFINSIGTKLAMEKEKRSYLTLLSFVLRVSLVLLSVVVVCKSNFQNVIFLLLGYSLNFISITIYGIGLGRNKA